MTHTHTRIVMSTHMFCMCFLVCWVLLHVCLVQQVSIGAWGRIALSLPPSLSLCGLQLIQ